jgi:hypothetical protein
MGGTMLAQIKSSLEEYCPIQKKGHPKLRWDSLDCCLFEVGLIPGFQESQSSWTSMLDSLILD